MRRIMLILLLLGMCMTVGMVEAQDEEILYIRLDCDCETDAVFDEILRQLGEVLAPYQIRLQGTSLYAEGEDYEDWDEFLTIHVFYNMSENPEGDTEFLGYSIGYSMSSSRLETAFAEISPLLNHEIYFGYGLTDCNLSGDCNLQINPLTIMSLYLLNHCDLIEDFINAAPQDEGQDYPTRLAVKEIRANCAILDGDYPLAQEILESAELSLWWLKYPLEQVSAKLAWLYLQNGQTEEAIELMNGTVTYSNEYISSSDGTLQIPSVTALTLRAQIYALAFDYDSAIADMDEAIAVAEEYELANNRLAHLYTERGKIIFLLYEWDRVLENFNHAIELDPNYAPAYFERGVLYYTMTQRENALADFQHYLELEPDGLHAEEAAQYIESIEIELEALGG
jgi:tetratricopeptide (TPR) repeat protein